MNKSLTAWWISLNFSKCLNKSFQKISTTLHTWSVSHTSTKITQVNVTVRNSALIIFAWLKKKQHLILCLQNIWFLFRADTLFSLIKCSFRFFPGGKSYQETKSLTCRDKSAFDLFMYLRPQKDGHAVKDLHGNSQVVEQICCNVLWFR